MPELPDVEVFKRYADATVMQRPIRGAEVSDASLVKRGGVKALQRALAGSRFTESRRHGKLLFLGTDSGFWLGLHFGMTGYLDVAKAEGTPEHTRLRIDFADGYRLAYILKRKLGAIFEGRDWREVVEAEGLGPDALALSEEAFCALADEHGRSAVKCWLMKQQVLAGIGNVYSDEILFQAGIHPRRKLGTLQPQSLKSLYHILHRVVEAAVEAKVDPAALPKGFLLPHRQPGEACPRCGGEVAKIKACGRSAYVCPRCQPA